MGDEKLMLHRYLQAGRDAVLWKLDGLEDYDVRRPIVPTGTNLLGLVKHLTSVELGYFGVVFGRMPAEQPSSWADGAQDDDDLWARADERRDDLVRAYRTAWSHADATIDELPLDAAGQVPWWGEAGRVTLHRVLVHVATETHRHAGHADILRELIDGSAGLQQGNDNLTRDAAGWAGHRERIEREARLACEGGG
jgi:uncharacterized damage-inducible protein DinB